jgi:hypothetical protein
VDGQHGRHQRDEQCGDNGVPRNPPVDHPEIIDGRRHPRW